MALALYLMLLLGAVQPEPASSATLPLVTSWGGAPSTAPGSFNQLEDVSVAPNGDVFTIENGGGAADRVQRFSGGGTPLQAPFGTEGAGGSAWNQPISLVVSPASEVFGVDTFDSKVSRFTAAGAQIGAEWGALGGGAGEFSSPEGLAFAGGNVVVADRANNQVDVYGVTGTQVIQWGGPGSSAGLFNRIVEVNTGPDGDVYAVDRDNSRVQRFTPTGAFVGTYGGTAGSGPGQLSSPSDVAVDPAGDVWVSDQSNSRISRFAANGAFKANYEQVGGLPVRAVGLDFAPNGDLLIADVLPGSYRVIRARTAGAGAGAGGGAGTGGGAGLPAPVLGKAVNVVPVRGKLFVSVPGNASVAAAVPGLKGRKFVPLTTARQLPVGTFVDTRKGTIRLTSASTSPGKTLAGEFSAGVFQVLQSRKKRQKGLTTLTLKGGSFRKRCKSRARRRRAGGATAARRRRSRRTVRRLRGKGRGRFRTRGRHSAATVRGTTWETRDRCDGTLTRVRRGRVVVRDLRRKRNIRLKAGKSYLARAPG